MANPDIDIDLDELNDTELVALCNWVGIRASRAWPRGLLIESLETFEPIDIDQPLDVERGRMGNYLRMYWDRYRLQVDKKVCPNCFECSELQILSCYNKNKKRIEGK